MTGSPARDASGMTSLLHIISCGKNGLLVFPCCSFQGLMCVLTNSLLHSKAAVDFNGICSTSPQNMAFKSGSPVMRQPLLPGRCKFTRGEKKGEKKSHSSPSSSWEVNQDCAPTDRRAPRTHCHMGQLYAIHLGRGTPQKEEGEKNGSGWHNRKKQTRATIDLFHYNRGRFCHPSLPSPK